jgi:hypothetical protein
MGWYFRRAIGFGPFRLNLSKSGLGWSVGRRGLRGGRDARGRRTTHASIPGTGVGYRTAGQRGAKHGCLLVLVGIPLIGGGAFALCAGLVGAFA